MRHSSMNFSAHTRTLAAALALFAACNAFAGEGTFGWVYTLDIQPKGKFELEQKIDDTHGQATGHYNFGLYRTELEYGVTNDFQLGAYLNAATIDSDKNYLDADTCNNVTPCTAGFGVPGNHHDQSAFHLHEVDGVSLEGIWRLTNPVTSPVGVGLYLEPTLGRLENELEARLLLQSNFVDDRLVLAVNFLYEMEKEKYDRPEGVILNSMGDVLYGANYRFADNWTAGLEARYHTDHDGYWFNTRTQTARFAGPNLHYAAQNWWATLAWRHELGGGCNNDGTADCSEGHVWDNHGRNEYLLKVGYQFN
jgi:opacity protein-like surface antigen